MKQFVHFFGVHGSCRVESTRRAKKEAARQSMGNGAATVGRDRAGPAGFHLAAVQCRARNAPVPVP